MENQPSLSIGDIEAARARLEGKAVVTPLLSPPVLAERCGGTVLLKAETLQRMGAFKFRGAYNRLSLIDPELRKNGVVACSSGNHAQGVAEAARLYGVPATIVMPADAPKLKTARTKAAGAKVVTYDRERENRIEIAEAIARETGATFVHPYDDLGVMAGQGTVGLEIADTVRARGGTLDAVLVPCGGGGLTAGVATAVKDRFPGAEIYTVEPAGFDDHARSFASGTRRANTALSGSIADALMAETPGEMTFAVNRRLVTDGLVVDDAQILDAVAYAARELKLIVEPGGVVALAAILFGLIETKGRTVCAVLSGGNIDDDLLCKVLQRPALS